MTDLGLIVDWCALYQAPRTPEQDASFQQGLRAINLWYAHQGTSVWLVTAGRDRVNGLSYGEKGWCSFEFALAMMIKPANTAVFKDWVASIEADERLFVTAVHIQNVDMFGPRVGFVKFTAAAKLVVGNSGDPNEDIIDVPGIVFMRGGAVGVLVILECDDREYTIVTYQ